MNSSNEKYLYDRKINKLADVNIWMVFPGPESFAMSSLGYLWLFKGLDELEYVNVERVYADSVSTDISVNSLDMAAFSFSFDTDFMNAFAILEKYHIPLKKKDREDTAPVLYAGGPVITANPTPYEDFFDFFIIGDGEDINNEVVKIYSENKDLSKQEYLKKISELEGVYVPDLTKFVKKRTKNLETCVYTPIISDKAFFPNTFIMEVARGCANRCGFCIASYLNLPLRSVPYEKIIETIEIGLKNTNKIALLGAQLSAHPRFEDICEYIYQKIQAGKDIEMSVSSLRVDSITPNILKTLVACGQKNVTLAIEAGSERLRRVINKNLTKEQIFNAVEIAKNSGLKGFKFYGMLGLPTENPQDIEEIIALAKELKKAYKGFDISFGFSTFVPKPNTPFQWCAREDSKSLENKSNYIKKELHKSGIEVSVSSVKWDYWQAFLSRADNTIGDFLITVYKNGGKLGAYNKAAKIHNINPDKFAISSRSFDDKLPWDFIELNPDKAFLISECKRLISC